MSPSITVREARYPADFPIMAALISAERHDWPVSAEELAVSHAGRDPNFYELNLIAELDGVPAGVGNIGHIPYMHRPGRFGLDLRVPMDLQGRGVGKALYDALMERIRPLEPRELITEVWEALPRPRRFLEERGFQAVWRRIDSELDPRGFDFAPFRTLEERASAAGIRIVTYADLAADPERERKLHDLDFELLSDMPYGEPQTKVPLEQFVAETITAPGFLPDACFIALHGGEWIGYSNLRDSENFFAIQMTGVRAPWRGRGLATLLKLRGIAYAQTHGAKKLATTNDHANIAMLAINHRLGFQEIGAMLRYKKVI